MSLLQPGANSISETGQPSSYFTSIKTSTKARQSSAYGVSKYKTSMSLWSQNLASAVVANSRAQGNTWDKCHPLLPSVGTPSFDSLVYFRFLRLHSGHICNRKKLRSKEAARLETREKEGDRTRVPKSHCFFFFFFREIGEHKQGGQVKRQKELDPKSKEGSPTRVVMRA